MQVGWLSDRELVPLHISAIVPVHCHEHHGQFQKDKDMLKMLQSLQLYTKEKQTAYRCFGELRSCSTGRWMRPFSGIHFCTGTVENSGKVVIFFLSFRSSPYSWEGSVLSPPSRQALTYVRWWPQRLKIQVEWNTSLPRGETRAPLAMWMMCIFVDPVLFFLCVYSHNKLAGIKVH